MGRKKLTAALEELVAKAKKIQMTEGQLREQRLSFVYGNTHIENERITREMVAAADAKVEREEAAAR
jgi:chromosome condensin MukBEF complex kleisin-like MukF subunit